MVAHKHITCSEAEIYHYEYACGTAGKVPDDVRVHIAACPSCTESVHILKGMTTEPGRQTHGDPRLYILRLHMAFVNQPLDCRQVRPFLATQAEPSLRVSAPTPITVHIERCESCRRDLALLESLNLRPRQLSRLSEFFTHTPAPVEDLPPEEKESLARDVAFMRYDGIDVEHLRRCLFDTDFQRRIHDFRAEYTCPPVDEGMHRITCDMINPSDLFDLAFPYGINPLADEYALFRRPLLNHIRACAACTRSVQHMHDHIFGMYHRPESGVTTLYRTDKDAAAARAQDGIPGIFHVETKNPQPAPVPRKTRRLPAYLKVGALAASLLILAGLFFFNSYSLQADRSMDVSDDGLVKAPYLRVTSFSPVSDAPDETVYFSRPDRQLLCVSTSRSFLIDLGEKKRYLLTPDGTFERENLSREDYGKWLIHMKSSFGYLPPEPYFNDYPRQRELLQSTAAPGTPSGDLVEYEIESQVKRGLQMQMQKRVYTIDQGLGRVVGTELFTQDPSGNYRPAGRTTIDYPSAAEVKNAIRDWRSARGI